MARAPKVGELVLLVEELERKRAFVAAAQEAILGSLSVHVEAGHIVFSSSTSERLRTDAPAREVRRHKPAA